MSVLPAGEQAGVRVLRAEGELDAVTATRVLPGVPALVDGARAVVLDLSAVTFFDSSGVRLLDQLARECSRCGAPFRVVAPPGGSPRRVLEIVGMAGALAVDDLPTALVVVQSSAC